MLGAVKGWVGKPSNLRLQAQRAAVVLGLAQRLYTLHRSPKPRQAETGKVSLAVLKPVSHPKRDLLHPKAKF